MTAAILSAVIGVSCGMSITGAVLLGLKLSAVSISPVYYVLLGLGGALLVGGAMFLLLRPTDARLAKHLDETYGLQERVRTALAYKDAVGFMAQAQRTNTAEQLAALQLRKPGPKQISAFVLAILLSLALLVTALAVPVKSTDAGAGGYVPSTVDDSYALSEFQRFAVEDLITDINGSALTDGVKANITAALNALITELEAADKVDEMQTAVVTCLQAADGYIKDDCSYYAIGSMLLNAESKELARVLAYGAEFVNRYSVQSNANLRDFWANRVANAENALSPTLTELQLQIAGYVAADMTQELSDYVSKLSAGLSMTETHDVLYDSLAAFRTAIESDLTAENIVSLFDGLAYSLSNELGRQAYNLAAGKYVRSVLLAQFDIPSNMLDIVAWNLSDKIDGSLSGNDKENGGGYGDGSQIFGSDDQVYDPLTGEYVPYGELLQKYYEIVQAFLNEGAISDEQAAAVRNYFTLLFGGFDKKN